MLIHRQIVVPHVGQPIDDIFSPIPSSDARRAADAEMHLSAGDVHILRDLTTRLARANHEHFASVFVRPKLIGITILR